MQNVIMGLTSLSVVIAFRVATVKHIATLLSVPWFILRITFVHNSLNGLFPQETDQICCQKI